jgi:hypothetical protein
MEAVIMRIGIVIALAAVLAMPCYAARRITVEEFEQTLASCKAAHQSDASIARQLSAMELTERLSSARLERLKAGLPGIKARTALLALAAPRSSSILRQRRSPTPPRRTLTR